MNTSENPSPSQENSKSQQNPEEALYHAIAEMESSLSLEGSADFKRFWEVRELCLSLFKENIPPPIRGELWKKYQELTKQARLLKEHFEEESSFAIEQIEMAISALEKEITEPSQIAEQVTFKEDFLSSATLKNHREKYLKIQQELTLLNAYASRINALRKELTQMNMRMRKKGQLFERLSAIGDRVMPRRKELIQEISSLFIEDVEQFVHLYFSKKGPTKPIYFCRDEIKALQGAAKNLSINTKVFSETRMKLSACWDALKEKEKENKKELAEKKELFKANAEEIRKKIETFTANMAVKVSTTDEMREELDQLIKQLREKELSRDDVKILKEEIALAKRPLLERIEEEAKKKRQLIQEKEEKKRAQIQAFEKEIKEFVSLSEGLESAKIVEQAAALRDKMGDLELSLLEKERYSRSLTATEESALEKAETLYQLPEDPKAAIKALQTVFKSKQERRKVIKERIEKCRKVLGGSGLDFEQLLHYNEQFAMEKEHYEKMGREMEALEKKIAQLKANA